MSYLVTLTLVSVALVVLVSLALFYAILKKSRQSFLVDLSVANCKDRLADHIGMGRAWSTSSGRARLTGTVKGDTFVLRRGSAINWVYPLPQFHGALDEEGGRTRVNGYLAPEPYLTGWGFVGLVATALTLPLAWLVNNEFALYLPYACAAALVGIIGLGVYHLLRRKEESRILALLHEILAVS